MAAKKLYISQPSLSQYLKRLEGSLGAELFDRSTSPMTLTDAGERYYDYILNLKRMESNMKEELLDIKRETRGKLRLGIALWRGACLIPDVFPEFHRRYPFVDLELFEGRFIQMKQALTGNEIDLAIANLLPAGDYADFDIEPVMQERILLAAPACNPYIQEQLKKQKHREGLPIVSFDILNRIPVVLTKEGQSLTEMVTSVLARKRIAPEILMKTSNLTTAINLTARGMCCTFVPEEGARICQHPGQVIFFAFDDPDFSWMLSFMYRKNTYLGSIKRNFIKCTKEILLPGHSDCHTEGYPVYHEQNC